jgi:hypothetical protein
MIVNKVYRALKDIIGPFNVEIKKNDELHIVTDVIYYNGYPLPFEMQLTFYSWLVNNEEFIDDTRNF